MANIIIAEDERIAQMEVYLTLEKMGHSAFICPNGKHAYEALLSYNKFDLLITDFIMPEMDGRALVKAIQEEKSIKKIPIIVMSGVIAINEISDLMDHGASFFVSKPIKAALLGDYINKCLQP